MYDAFYGFRDKPFSLLPDPDYLYLSPQHEKALGLLELSLHNQAGFCVISGEIGAGKTTLIRKLLTLAGPEFRVGLVSNTLDSFGELLNWILLAYDLPGGGTPVEQHERFLDFIIQQYGRGRRTVLIVDEAQNLGVDALEELRMLSNVNADKHQVLQVILVGQVGLRDTLKRPELAQFAQRILLDFHLGPLGRADTAQYIRHRVLVAGADPQLFTEDAAAAVFRYSGGVPRIINLLCDTALVYGYAEGRTLVDAELIHAVARDRQSSGVAPALRLAAVAPPAPDPVEQVRGLSAVPLPEPMMPLAPAAPEETGQEPEPPPAVESSAPASGAESGPESDVEPGPGTEPGDTGDEVTPPVITAEPVTTEPPPVPEAAAPVMADGAQGDAEWLRQLADSAVPTALRETVQAAPVPDTTEPDPGAADQPHVRQAPKASSRPVSRAGTGAGLGRVATGLLLLGAGVAGYWYFGISEQEPAQAAEVPAVAVPAPAQPLAESRPASPPPETLQVDAIPIPEPEPEPVGDTPVDLPPLAPERPRVERVTGQDAAPPPAEPASAGEAEPEEAVVQGTAPPPAVAQPARAAPPPRPDPAPRPAPRPVASAPTPEPVAPAAPEPTASESPVLAPVPEPEAFPEPLPSSPSPVRAEAVAGVSAAPASGEPEDDAPEEAAPVTAEPQPFTTDPCRGPAARYLSTCR
jgi:general secretion pathway protein A